MSIQEQRRARFEEWILSDYVSDGDRDLVARDNEGDYCSVGVAERWETYNAALDSVVIELPPCIDADEVAEHFAIDEEGHDMAVGISQMVNGAIIACGAFIKAAGLKVAP